MTFEQVITIFAIVNAPLGIYLTWHLTERARDNRAAAEAREAAEVEQRERVIEAIELAETVAGDARSLTHAVYLKHVSRRTPVGFQDMVESFNTARSRLDHVLLRLRVLGPTWAVKPGEEVQSQAQELVQVIGNMESQFRSALLTQAQEMLPTFDEAVAAFVDEVAAKYNCAAAELPERPPHPDRVRDA